jgi:hypothetical protein
MTVTAKKECPPHKWAFETDGKDNSWLVCTLCGTRKPA